MKKIKQNILLVALVWSLLSLSNQPIFAEIGNKTSEVDTVKVLTIGNSFANNACRFLDEITGSVEGCEIIIGKANLGGHSLEQHASYIKQSEEDPDFKAYSGGTKSLKDFLQEEEWDAVTIQQASSLSIKSESFQPYADEIVDHINEYSPNSQIHIHQTWAYAPDAPRLNNLGVTYEEMYEKLTANYLELSERYDDAPILRSGDAFYNSYEMNNEIDLWNADDRFHASIEGSYLGGCVWFSRLFKKDPSIIRFIPDGMSQETAKHLKEVAISVSRYDSISVQGVSIHSCPSDTLFKNVRYQLNASVFPYNAGEQSVTWSSSNPAVATVDTTGLVNALSEGNSIITVTTHEGSFTDVCEVEVKQRVISVYGVTIGNCPSTILRTGDKHQLTANVAPENATQKSVTWSPSNTQVATVDSTGLVTAKSQGSVTITVTTNDGGFTRTCTIGIMSTGVSVTGVTLSGCPAGNLEIDSTYQLIAHVAPSDAGDLRVSWSSSNEEVASVDETGLITLLSAGETTITVTTNDGDFTAECSITVDASTTVRQIDGAGQFVELFPNPASDVIHLRFSESASEKAISIFNTHGQLLFSKNTYSSKTQIDIRQFHSEGMLIVKVVSGAIAASFKVIIQ